MDARVGAHLTRDAGRRGAAAVALLVALSVTLGAPMGHADEPESAEASEAAMGVLKAARLLYKRGKHADAARLFHQAWAIDPKPAFLYNAGRAEQRAFKYREAVHTFERLLAIPQLEDRITHLARVRQQECRDLLARFGDGGNAKGTPEKNAAPVTGAAPAKEAAPEKMAPPPTGVTPAVVAQGGTTDSGALAWVTLGGGGLLAGGAAVLALLARSDAEALRRDLESPDARGVLAGLSHEEALDRAAGVVARQRWALGLGVAGAVAAGAGAWLLMTSEPSPAVAATEILPWGRGFAMRVRW